MSCSDCCLCRPISKPLEAVLPKKYAPVIQCSSTLVFGAAVVIGATLGFGSGLAVYNAVCPRNSCTGLSDAKSYISDAIPFIGALVGVIALPVIVCGAAQAIGCCFKKRQAIVMQQLPDDFSDKQPLLDRSDPT